MKKIKLIVVTFCIAMFLFGIPFLARGEFVFTDIPTEELNATPAPTATPFIDETIDGVLDDTIDETANDSIMQFIDYEPEEVFAVPTKTPILNDTWPRQIVITVGGDCTIGNTVGQSESPLGFKAAVEREGYAWPFSGIISVLSQDDLTLVNCEGTFTDNEDRTEKLYNFKGPSEYATILSYGSVEAVTLANNHSLDYGQKGKEDTMAALAAAGITYFDEKQTAIYEVRGVKIGLIGNSFPYKDEKRDISKEVKALRDAGCQIVLASFHWGSEGEYNFTREQRKIGRAAVKSGADAVIGHHPHVIQSIEKYEGTYILYSLGNLVFGGNVDPKDRDTYLAQLTFMVNEDGSLEGEPQLKLIPTLLTEMTKNTDYRPVLVEDTKAYDRIMKKILNKSTNMEGFVNPQ